MNGPFIARISVPLFALLFIFAGHGARSAQTDKNSATSGGGASSTYEMEQFGRIGAQGQVGNSESTFGNYTSESDSTPNRSSIPVVVDGVFTDWADKPMAIFDGAAAGLGCIDFSYAKFFNDDLYFYGLVSFSDSTVPTTNSLSLFFDLDDNSATGESLYGIGAELLYRFDGAHRIEQGNVTFIPVHSAFAPTTASLTFEFCIERRPSPALPQFPDLFGPLRLAIVLGSAACADEEGPFVANFVMLPESHSYRKHANYVKRGAQSLYETVFLTKPTPSTFHSGQSPLRFTIESTVPILSGEFWVAFPGYIHTSAINPYSTSMAVDSPNLTGSQYSEATDYVIKDLTFPSESGLNGSAVFRFPHIWIGPPRTTQWPAGFPRCPVDWGAPVPIEHDNTASFTLAVSPSGILSGGEVAFQFHPSGAVTERQRNISGNLVDIVVDLESSAPGAYIVAYVPGTEVYSYFKIGTPDVPPPDPGELLYEPLHGGIENPTDPIMLFSGEFVHEETDLFIPCQGFDFEWKRIYRSRLTSSTVQGNNWDFGYNISLRRSGEDVILNTGSHRADHFEKVENQEFWTRSEYFGTISRVEGIFYLSMPDGSRWIFKEESVPGAGMPIDRIVDQFGNTMSFHYGAATNQNSKQVLKKIDLPGSPIRKVHISYIDVGSEVRIQSVFEDPSDFYPLSREYVYLYADTTTDPNGLPGALTRVYLPEVDVPGIDHDQPQVYIEYVYDKSQDLHLKNNLLRIYDAKQSLLSTNNKVPYLENLYYSGTSSALEPDCPFNDNRLFLDRVVQQRWGGSEHRLHIAYYEDPEGFPDDFSPSEKARFLEAEFGHGTVSLSPRKLAIVNDRNGNVKHYYYDDSNRLVVKREYTGRSKLNPEHAGEGGARAFPDSYNDNLCTTRFNNRPWLESYRQGGSGTPAEETGYYTTSFFWNDNSQLIRAVYPREGVSTDYRYDDANQDPRRRGNLLTITHNRGPNELVEEFPSYASLPDGNGPAEYVDGNGNRTIFFYEKGHLKARLRGNATSLNGVTTTVRTKIQSLTAGDIEGHLTGASTTYTDVLSGLANLPNVIVEMYTYDQFGRRIHQVLPSNKANNAGHRRIDKYDYNSLGYLWRITESYDPLSNESDVNSVTQLAPDSRGNPTHLVDPNGHETEIYFNQMLQPYRYVYDQVPYLQQNGTLENGRHRLDLFYDANGYAVRVESRIVSPTGMAFSGDPEHYVTEYERDLLNQIVGVRRGISQGPLSGLQTTLIVKERFKYDENQNLVEHAFGQSNPLLGEVTQPDNRVLLFYDERDLPYKRQAFGEGGGDRTSLFYYDGNKNLSLVVEAVGQQSSNVGSCDVKGQGFSADQLRSPNSFQVHEFEYDSFDRLQTYRNPIRAETHFTYDHNGNLLSEYSTSNDPSQSSWGVGTFHYDFVNRLEGFTRSRGAYTNSENSWPSGATDQSVSYGYADTSDIEKIDISGITEGYGYDRLKRLKEFRDGIGNARSFVYDKNGNVKTQVLTYKETGSSSTEDHVIEYSYDKMDRLSSLINRGSDTSDIPLPNDPLTYSDVEWSYYHDSRGNAVAVTDPRGFATRIAYDGLQRATEVRMEWTSGHLPAISSIVSQFVYDHSSRVIRATDPEGNDTDYAYDSSNRLIGVRRADGRIAQVGQNLDLNWDPQNLYPNLGQPSAPFISGFDSANNPVRFSDFDGVVYTRTFTLQNLLCEEAVFGQSWQKTFDYATAPFPTRVSVTESNHLSNYTVSNRLAYTRNGDLFRDTQADIGKGIYTKIGSLGLPEYHSFYPTPTWTDPACHLTYHYDEQLRVKEIKRGSNSVTSAGFVGPFIKKNLLHENGASTQFSHDQFGRISSAAHSNATGLAVESVYRRDPGGYKAKLQQTLQVPSPDPTPFRDFAADVTHNEIGHIQAIDRSVGDDSFYSWDRVGNRVSVSRGSVQYDYSLQHEFVKLSESELNQYAVVSREGLAQKTYQYDLRGNLAAIYTGSYNPGVSAPEVERTYEYDSRNLLQKASFPANPPAYEGDVYHYDYDALGRRIQKNPVNGAVTAMFYWGDRLAMQANNYFSSTGEYDSLIIFEYGDALDERFMMRKISSGAVPDEEIYYYHLDENYSVYLITDENGGVVEYYEYDEFGSPTLYDATGSQLSNAVSSVGNPFMFQGQYYDSETGLYWFKTRYYDPNTGRFTSMDPLGIWGDQGSMGNAYVFARNNPLFYLDPMGLSSIFSQEIFDAALIGAGEGLGTWANSFTFGYTDQWGLTNTRNYTSPGLRVSAFAGNLSRETLIVATTGGAATMASRCGVTGARLMAARGITYGGVAYNVNGAAEGIYDGLMMIKCGNVLLGSGMMLLNVSQLGGDFASLMKTMNRVCFPAGAVLVRTARGDIPIEEVEEGDRVQSLYPSVSDTTGMEHSFNLHSQFEVSNDPSIALTVFEAKDDNAIPSLGSLVEVFDGETFANEDIQILAEVDGGDYIVYDGVIWRVASRGDTLTIASTQTVMSTVSRKFVSASTELMTMTLRSEDGEESEITATPEHPFYVPSLRRYVPLRNLAAGDLLWGGDELEVLSISSSSQNVPVYNIEVSQTHNYFVSSASGGAWVNAHNTCVPKGGTYVLKNQTTGEVVRTGRSNNLARRRAEHARDPGLKVYLFETTHQTDIYAQQRGLEQLLHETYNPVFDFIQPISSRNPLRQKYLDAANGFLRGGN